MRVLAAANFSTTSSSTKGAQLRSGHPTPAAAQPLAIGIISLFSARRDGLMVEKKNAGPSSLWAGHKICASVLMSFAVPGRGRASLTAVQNTHFAAYSLCFFFSHQLCERSTPGGHLFSGRAPLEFSQPFLAANSLPTLRWKWNNTKAQDHVIKMLSPTATSAASTRP